MKNKNILVGVIISSIIMMVFIGTLVNKNNKEKEEINKSMVTNVQFWGNKEIANKAQEQFRSKKERQLKKLENIRKKKNEFYGIAYDFVKDGSHDYIGGQNDFTKLGLGKYLAKLSTEKGFLQYVNKAVGYLTMGAYEDKIRNQFIGKTWNGMKIKGCDITTYKVHEKLGVQDKDILKKKGVMNLPKEKFTALIGGYEDANDDDNIYFVRVVVTFE